MYIYLFILFLLQMIVAGFAGRLDMSKAAETANEVRRVMKDLKDCQSQGALYNQRERLFGMPVTQVRSSTVIVDIMYHVLTQPLYFRCYASTCTVAVAQLVRAFH